MCAPEPYPVITTEAALARAAQLVGRPLTGAEKLMVIGATIAHNDRIRREYTKR